MKEKAEIDFELIKIIKEIKDREAIIDQYQRTGLLDRSMVIQMIESLRLTDSYVQAAVISSFNP